MQGFEHQESTNPCIFAVFILSNRLYSLKLMRFAKALKEIGTLYKSASKYFRSCFVCMPIPTAVVKAASFKSYAIEGIPE
jgi:hypothetical protein